MSTDSLSQPESSFKRKLVLVLDTNIFIQCKDLRELAWNTWPQVDDITLLVTRPVVTEIDSQKSRGNDRVATRARTTSAMFKKLIRGAIEIRPSEPTVRLQLRQDLKPDQSLSDALDYRERDNQLVGIAATFRNENPDIDVQLLTHDVGPMASANSIGLACNDVPENWLLPREPDERDKKLAAQNEELRKLKNAAPVFKSWFEHNGEAITKFVANHISYCPLDAEQLADLMSRIKVNFPEASDFGPGAAEIKQKSFGFDLGLFAPATTIAIEAYKKAYLKWLDKCEKRLRILHETLSKINSQPKLQVFISNDGQMPAERALVYLKTEGLVYIFPTSDVDGEDSQDLPAPPIAPKGSITLNQFGNYAVLQPVIMDIPDLSRRFVPRKRDRFYYADGNSAIPSAFIELECEQWRHRAGPEVFDVFIYVDMRNSITKGELTVTVSATNLIEPFLTRIPISVTTEQVGSWDKAEQLVQRLIGPTVTFGTSTGSKVQ